MDNVWCHMFTLDWWQEHSCKEGESSQLNTVLSYECVWIFSLLCMTGYVGDLNIYLLCKLLLKLSSLPRILISKGMWETKMITRPFPSPLLFFFCSSPPIIVLLPSFQYDGPGPPWWGRSSVLRFHSAEAKRTAGRLRQVWVQILPPSFKCNIWQVKCFL